jgi:selenocysteine lyase/cysteine desulfurase
VGVSDAGDARRLETGNLNYPGIAGWAGALDLIEEAGPERIEPWVLELSQALGEGLRALGAQVVSPPGAASRSTTTALKVADPALALAHLAREGVVASIVEYGYVRLSVGAYNNHADIDRILRAARAFAA